MSANINIHIAGENALILYFSEQTHRDVFTRVQKAEQLIRHAIKSGLSADIIDLVQIILSDQYIPIADIDEDGFINVTDIVTLINIILSS